MSSEGVTRHIWGFISQPGWWVVLNTLHPTVYPGSTHSRTQRCHSSTCFSLNQQCHVKPDCKLTKITESCTEMSIQTSDCSLSMSHSDGQNGNESSQTHTFEWRSVFNPECRSDAPRQRVCVGLKYSPANSLICELFHPIELLLHLRCLSSRAA